MSSVSWELLERFLAQQCDAEDRAWVERWIGDTPSGRLRAGLLVEAVDPGPVATKADAWARLLRRLATPGGPSSGQARSWRIPSRVAALGAAMVVAGILVAIALSSRNKTSGDPALRVLSTPSGQRASFQLPDSTKVILGVASTLRHPPAFDASVRQIELEGEAYFEVAPDTRRPFVVRARNLVAEDVGTEFLVRAYPEDAAPSVVVRDGRVALRLAAAPAHAARQILLAGQLGRLAADGRPTVEQADTSAYFAWTQGWLVFDGVPLRAAIPQLSRWYDLDFRLADSSLGEVPLTATFRNQPTDEVLQLLAASLGMSQARQGRKVTFHRATGAR
jgi:transmembrane sensor